MNKTELKKLKKDIEEALVLMYGAFGYFCMAELENGNKWAKKSSKLFKELMENIDKQLRSK